MPYKCMIIGLGQIGMGYDLVLDPIKAVYTHARAFSEHLAFELVSGVDPSEMRRVSFTQHYGQPAYSNIATALQGQDIDVVIIAAPTSQHNLILKEVLAHSKPCAILCEKPLAYDLSEAREMVEACDCAGIKLFVNYMRRADPGAVEINRRIKSGQILAPIKGIAWYSKGFLNNGSHFFNLLEFWLGSFVKATVLDAGRIWDNQDPEPDVQVEFTEGKVVFMSAWEESFSHYTIELLSPSGRLRYEHGGEQITWQSVHADPKFAGYKILKTEPEIIPNGMGRYQWHVVNQLDCALTNKQHTLSTGAQSLSTIEAMHLILNQR